MQFVIVLFPELRQVFIDDGPQGMTGATQAVENGFHKFDLGEPQNYAPLQQVVEVTGTTPTSPMPIIFGQAVALAEPCPPVGATKRAAAAAIAARPAAATARRMRPAAARKRTRSTSKPRGSRKG
jgi:hypothetical protein